MKSTQEKRSRPTKKRQCILGVLIDATSYPFAVSDILQWTSESQSRTICLANVHMVMEAYDDHRFRSILNKATLVTPDGVPLVWMMRILGNWNQRRVYGPDLMKYVCEAAAKARLPVGLLGSAPDTLDSLVLALSARFPELQIVFSESPPFRDLTIAEDEALSARILASGARILFVGLGCPKQEKWMAAHRGILPIVMIGVGAAFDFHAGRVPQAPAWIQAAGLEWLFRLVSEPRRLWKRYLKHNPRFIAYSMLQILQIRQYGTDDLLGPEH